MANDKIEEFDEGMNIEVSDTATRARNRTVMLTPEITGQVRARLSREADLGEKSSGAFSLPELESEYVAPNFQSGNRAKSSDSSANNGNPILRELPLSTVVPAKKQFALPTNLSGSSQLSSVNQEMDSQPREDSRLAEGEFPANGHKPAFDKAKATEAPQCNDDVIVWQKTTAVVGFLVSFDRDPNGEVYFMRSGRLVVSSQVPQGWNYLFLQDESISPMHAIMRVTEDAQIQVLDNLSEFGSTIVKSESAEEITLSGDKAIVHHGDILRFGKRSFSVCLIGN